MFGLNINEMLQASEKIQAFIPQIKKFIPSLIDAQKTYSGKQNLKQREFLLYSFLLNNSGKIFLYAFKCETAKTGFKVNETDFPKGCVIIKQECFKIELTQYLDTIEQKGLLGFLQTIPVDSLMSNFMK